jgi:hypothetical protein
MNGAAVLTAGAVDAVRACYAMRRQRTGSTNSDTSNFLTEQGK